MNEAWVLTALLIGFVLGLLAARSGPLLTINNYSAGTGMDVFHAPKEKA